MARQARRTEVCIAQVQLHAANVGLVGDGFGVELEHDGETQAGGAPHRFGLGGGDMRFHRRDALRRQKLLGFEFGQQAAALMANRLEHGVRLMPGFGHVLGFGREQREFRRGRGGFAV